MKLPTITELLKKLDSEHLEGEHLYRGQMQRYPPHEWYAHGELLEVEALYPADYRFLYGIKDFSSSKTDIITRSISAARSYGRTIRDEFAFFLFLALLQNKNSKFSSWALDRFPEFVNAVKNKQPPLNTHFMRTAWSIAQHYLVATALTDLTYSTRVAAWFATEPWERSGKKPDVGSIGVFYRINQSKILPILNNVTLLSKEMSNQLGDPITPDLFLVDIRDVPPDFARRPTSQQGASLYGFDQALVIAASIKGSAIEIFEFEHQPDQNIDVKREDIVPSDDPFLQTLQPFYQFLDATSAGKSGTMMHQNKIPSSLDRANRDFGLGVLTANEIKQLKIDNQHVALVYGGIKKTGTNQIDYLMIIENTIMNAVLCAISAEPINLLPGISPAAVKAVDFKFNVMRVWQHHNSYPVEYGEWKMVDDFIDSALNKVKELIFD